MLSQSCEKDGLTSTVSVRKNVDHRLGCLQNSSAALSSLEQKNVDLTLQLEQERQKCRKLSSDADEASRVHRSKLMESEAELSRMQQSCNDLQSRIESLLQQMQSQMTAHASLKQQLEETEQNSTEQVCMCVKFMMLVQICTAEAFSLSSLAVRVICKRVAGFQAEDYST